MWLLRKAGLPAWNQGGPLSVVGVGGRTAHPHFSSPLVLRLSEIWVLGLSAPSPVAMRSCGTAARRAGQPRAKGDCGLILSIRAGPAINQESRGLSSPSSLWPLHLAGLFSHLCPL